MWHAWVRSQVGFPGTVATHNQHDEGAGRRAAGFRVYSFENFPACLQAGSMQGSPCKEASCQACAFLLSTLRCPIYAVLMLFRTAFCRLRVFSFFYKPCYGSHAMILIAPVKR